MIVHWTQRARRELIAQLKFIALDKPSAADRMGGIVERNTSMLAQWPKMGRPGHLPALRELAIVGTPFIAVYKLIGERVEIVRLLHGAQKWP